MLKFVFSGCLLLLAFTINAKNSEKINGTLPINYTIEIFNDTSGLSFNDVKKLPEDYFRKYQNQILYKDTVYWLRLEIEPIQSSRKDYLVCFNCMLTHIELYEPLNKDSFRVRKSGVYIPYSNKTVGGYLKDKVAFSLKNIGKTILYLRIYNQLEYKYTLDNFEITSKDEYYLKASNIYFFQGCFIGMMLILSIVNFVLFFFSRDKLYLYYSLYLLLIALFFFSNFQFSERYIFFNHPKLDIVLYWCVYLAQFIYLLFFLQLLKNEDVQIWRKYVKYYAWFSFTVYCTILVTGQISYPLGIIVSDFYTMLNVIFIIASFIIFYRRVKRTTKLVLIGTVIMVIGAFITTVIDFSKVSVNNIIYYQVGLFIEFVLFTVAVNYTYVKDRLEKVNVLYKNSVLELEKQQKEKENRDLQYEIDAKNRGLASKAILLSEKENLTTKLIKQLNKLKKGANDKFAVQDLINNLNISLSNNSRKEFEKHFNEVHPSFYMALSKKYPNLTASDRKLCAFMKLNLTTKEISTITGKSINTIDVARSRLRKKIGLESKDNLQVLVSNIN